MAVHDVNTQQEVYKIGRALTLAATVGILTNAMVNSATTNSGLRTAVNGATLPNNYNELQRQGVVKAIQRGSDLSVLTDAAINSATTVAGLVTLCGSPSGQEPFM